MSDTPEKRRLVNFLTAGPTILISNTVLCPATATIDQGFRLGSYQSVSVIMFPRSWPGKLAVALA